MLSNEKRAHDLAIASIPMIYDGFISKAREKVSSNNDTGDPVVFDVYAEYLKVYNLSLEKFNRDFPV